MIHQITITPIGGNNHTTRLSGKYFDTKLKQNVTLISPYGVVVGRPLTSNETEWKAWFNETTKKFVLTWDDANENDKDIAKFAAALKKHDSIVCEGNYNLNVGQFTLTDSRQAHLDKVSAIKARGQVFNIVNNMKASEMVDVSFFAGRSPVRKTAEEIFAELLDFQDGALMQNPAKFIADWRMHDRSHIVYAKKAEILGIIVKDNQTLKLNGEIIGSSTDDVVAYLKANEPMYEYVKKEVAEKDTLPVGVNKDAIVSSIVGKEQVEDVAIFKGETPESKAQRKSERDAAEIKHDDLLIELKKEARELGVTGYQSPFIKIETLQKKIAEKRIEMQKEKSASLQPA